MAFPIRFVRTWRSRPGSPLKAEPTVGSISMTKLTFLLMAASDIVISMSLKRGRIAKLINSKSSLPASTFEKSKMSLITVKRFSPERMTVSKESRCSLFRAVSSTNLVIPKIPFKGVRIS